MSNINVKIISFRTVNNNKHFTGVQLEIPG